MNLSQELSTFPIAPLVLTNLSEAGFMTVEDISKVSHSELSREADISEDQASEVHQKIGDSVLSSFSTWSCSAWDILQKENESPSITTFSESLDNMLNGGVPLAKITEFCGASGTGKTQICLQLCVDVQIPTDLGGLEGEVVYVDTEGSFIIDRLSDIAQATIDHCSAQTHLDDAKGSNFTLEKILQGIHLSRCRDQYNLMAVLQKIPELLQASPKVKLVIVDNIAAPVRQGFDDMLDQNQFLSFLGQTLVHITKDLGIAVVLTNQMTTKIDFQHSTSHLIPALGETWSHIPNTRVILQSDEDLRRALLYKSTCKEETDCTFQITKNGIRDVVGVRTDFGNPSQSSGLTSSSGMKVPNETQVLSREDQDGHPAKRARISL